MATIDAQDLGERIRRFRVLIVGRRNAGKTTILQKVCNTTDQPEIYDAKGHKIDAAIVKASLKRGKHDITNEIVFKSTPCFVFHDSCGFEAGGEEQFEKMKKFVSERTHANKLEERIHAIWYCIPMGDGSRLFQQSEEKFFLQCDTGRVPVVVVFTKFETLSSVAYGQIKKQLQGVSTEECSKRITQCVEELFAKTGVLNKLRKPENRARYKSYVRLENMNKPHTDCSALLECTTLTLDNEELRLCLLLTQQSNLELCIKCAVVTLIDRTQSQLFGLLRSNYDDYQYDIAKWFAHIKLWRWYTEWRRHSYDRYKSHDQKEVPDFNDNLFNEIEIERDDIIRVLRPLVAKQSLSTAAVSRNIQVGLATIIVLEYSAFLPNNTKDLRPIEFAVDYYLKSPTAVVVEKGAEEISRGGYDREEMGKKILEFILENRLSKDSTKKVDDA